MSDDRRAAALDRFRIQAKSCRELGSPFTARICDLAPGAVSGTRTGKRLADWPGNPGADAIALRLCGGLHRLVLDGRDPGLAAVYPPHAVDDEALALALDAAIRAHDDFLHAYLDSPPQTNEVGRSAILLPGFLWLARRFGRPLDILELGASAGLNLHWDAYAYRFGDVPWGPAGAPLTLEPEVRGLVPPLDGSVVVARRRAVDLNPLDPGDPEDRCRLTSYVWADQSTRLDRLAAALDYAAARPERVMATDAAAFVEAMAGERPLPGTLRVVCHSLFWQYLPEASRQRIAAALARAAEAGPLAWLRFEADGRAEDAGLSLALLPEGETRLLARGDFHGRWIDWRD
jgi:hypothetical protein